MRLSSLRLLSLRHPFQTAGRSAAIVCLLLSIVGQNACAGTLRERLQEHRAERQASQDGSSEELGEALKSLPSGVHVQRDLAYGEQPRQRFDLYRSGQPQGAPILLMVHGGGWYRGDKSMDAVVENKVARWVPKGFILVSVNYPLIPEAYPRQQAEAVAQAIAAVRKQAASWGGDPAQLILMGHSAGAHLVSLLNADPRLTADSGGRSWLGTVSLDSAAFNVEAIMQQRHLPLYDRAFGDNVEDWRQASPLLQLQPPMPPLLAVCSSRRDDSCAQAETFAGKAQSQGARVSVLQEDLSHRQINQELGEDSAYTQAVEAFMASLSPVVARHLGLGTAPGAPKLQPAP